MNNFQTLSVIVACVATLALSSSAVANSPNVTLAKFGGQNIETIASNAGFAIIDFEVQSDDQFVTPFGADVEPDAAHTEEMAALPNSLLECLNDCHDVAQSVEEFEACQLSCMMAFPEGLTAASNLIGR